MDLEL
jgi:hypothetical protein